MPWTEMFTKDVGHFFKWFFHWLRNGFKSKSILVYPHYPSRGSTLYKICKKADFLITNKPSTKHKLAIYWEYLTYREEYGFLEARKKEGMTVLNLYSRDISKKFVDKAFTRAFGYSSFVDPLKHTGKMVQKSDINAVHDGKIIEGPLDEAQEGVVYQKALNNQLDEKAVLDLRLPIIEGVVGFTYLKYREISARFESYSDRTEVKPSTEVFSEEEIHLLNKFCKEIHLDFGELDIIRNQDDGKVYVLDVNNTPQGPPQHMQAADKKECMQKLSKLFKSSYNNII